MATFSWKQLGCMYKYIFNSRNKSMVANVIVCSCMLYLHDTRWENYEYVKQSIICVLGSDQCMATNIALLSMLVCFRESIVKSVDKGTVSTSGSLIMWGDALEILGGSLNGFYKAIVYCFDTQAWSVMRKAHSSF